MGTVPLLLLYCQLLVRILQWEGGSDLLGRSGLAGRPVPGLLLEVLLLSECTAHCLLRPTWWLHIGIDALLHRILPLLGRSGCSRNVLFVDVLLGRVCRLVFVLCVVALWASGVYVLRSLCLLAVLLLVLGSGRWSAGGATTWCMVERSRQGRASAHSEAWVVLVDGCQEWSPIHCCQTSWPHSLFFSWLLQGCQSQQKLPKTAVCDRHELEVSAPSRASGGCWC